MADQKNNQGSTRSSDDNDEQSSGQTRSNGDGGSHQHTESSGDAGTEETEASPQSSQMGALTPGSEWTGRQGIQSNTTRGSHSDQDTRPDK